MRLAAFLFVFSLALPASGWAGQLKTPAKPKEHPATESRQPPRKWWHDEQYRSALRLSAEQASKIDRLFEDHVAVQRQLVASLQEAERDVSKLMASEAPEEAKVIAAIERTELLRYKINERRALLLFHIRQQLSLEQHRKLEKLHEKSRAARGRSGRRPSAPDLDIY